jgi:hypothetical protein
MLSLLSIWREADMRCSWHVELRARSFGTEVPQDDTGIGEGVRCLLAC